ncbi:MAG: hypothetical protein M3121_01620 [Chloroflexota bacterium]|nr:hypothetical protein [Chloroflexota bacterium]
MGADGTGIGRRPWSVALAAALGGLLWVPYGVFEMLQPWGEDTVYRDDRGYEVVTDTLLYWVYSLPGSLALLLTTLGLLGALDLLRLPTARISRIGLILAYVALGLAILSAVGVVTRFDPLFTGPRIFGTLALGGATVLMGVAAHRMGTAPGWAATLLALGLLGLFLLPLWPLVYAVNLVPEGGGTGIIALFGLGWVMVGYQPWRSQRQKLIGNARNTGLRETR